MNLTFGINLPTYGWKSMLFRSKDKSISIIPTKSKELSIVDVRNKKQRLKKQKAKISETKSKD